MPRAVALLSLLVVACATADEGGPPPLAPPPGELVRAHSHNDYEQPRPLENALAARVYSVEADVWLVEGLILVSHRPWDFSGPLDALYLDPLQERVDARGSVYGDGVPFTLWIDIKDTDPALRGALFALLERYDMLTRFDEGDVAAGPVTVVLTGDEAQKRAFVAEHPARRATRDEHAVLVDDPPADGTWGYYALNWETVVGWDGEGELPPGSRTALHELVSRAHEKGRPIRFWNLPDHEAGWQAALDADVDFINTDRVEELASFLASR